MLPITNAGITAWSASIACTVGENASVLADLQRAQDHLSAFNSAGQGRAGQGRAKAKATGNMQWAHQQRP